MVRTFLEVEVLETRQALSTMATGSLDPAPTTTTSSTSLIDPTLTPVSSTNTTVQVQITALGTLSGGRLTSITVHGLTAANVASGALGLVINGTTYTVDSATALANGDYRLTVLGGIDPTGVAVGGTAQVVLGTGSYVPPTSSTSTSTDEGLLDPTATPFTP